MCHFIKKFLNLCKRKEEQFNPFPSNLLVDEEVFLYKELFVKYKHEFLYIDHCVTYGDF